MTPTIAAMGDNSVPDDISNHPDLPKRDHMDLPGIKWRYGGPPDYTKVNREYLAGRTRKHAPDSLEKTVENLVKTWEFEATHKIDPKVQKVGNTIVQTIQPHPCDGAIMYQNQTGIGPMMLLLDQYQVQREFYTLTEMNRT